MPGMIALRTAAVPGFFTCDMRQYYAGVVTPTWLRRSDEPGVQHHTNDNGAEYEICANPTRAREAIAAPFPCVPPLRASGDCAVRHTGWCGAKGRQWRPP